MAKFGVILIGIVALLSSLGGIVLSVGITFFGWKLFGNPQADLMCYLYLLANPATPPWLQSYLMLYAIPEALRLMNLATLIGIFGAAVLIVSLIYFVAAIGLLAMKNWARIIMIIVGVLYLLGGIGTTVFGGITLSILLIIWGIINLLWGVIIIAYLVSDVKYEFE